MFLIDFYLQQTKVKLQKMSGTSPEPCPSMMKEQLRTYLLYNDFIDLSELLLVGNMLNRAAFLSFCAPLSKVSN